jgi:hypothetical protein
VVLKGLVVCAEAVVVGDVNMMVPKAGDHAHAMVVVDTPNEADIVQVEEVDGVAQALVVEMQTRHHLKSQQASVAGWQNRQFY